MNTSNSTQQFINPIALKKMGIPVILEPDYSSAFSIVFYPSRCHEFQGEWNPEEGSPKSASTLGKFHWRDSNCGQVRGRFAYLTKGRTLDGQEFNQLQLHERCGFCHNQFQVS